MMTESTEEAFKQNLKSLFLHRLQTGPLAKTQEILWNRFQELGLPTKHAELYRYIKLNRLYSRFFEETSTCVDQEALNYAKLPFCQDSTIVFVNGKFYPEYSSLGAIAEKLSVTPMEKAFQTYGVFLNNQFSKWIKRETDPFAILNGALGHSGAFVYVPPKTKVSQPVHILNIIDAKEKSILINPRSLIFIGAHSKVDIILTHELLSGSDYFCNQHIDFCLEDNSHVSFTETTFNASKTSWYFDSIRASLKRNSSFHSTNVTTGAEVHRSDYHIQLLGENSEGSLNGLWALQNAQESHTNVLIDHQAPHCRSMQLFKGVLNDRSHSSFEGKIYVGQDALKTDAFQLNNNLLLSDAARAESKPNLEIFADDVKASHGATVGQMNKEQLFYLLTRGFSSEQAKSILTRGFCQEVLGRIHHPEFQDKTHKQLYSKACIQ